MKMTGKYGIEHKQKMYKLFKDTLEAKGYLVVSTEYINNKYEMETRCPNGHIWFTNWDAVNAGKDCKECYKEGRLSQKEVNTKNKNRKKQSSKEEMYEEVKQALTEENYTLQDDHYTNNATKMKSICPRGHEWDFTWNAFQSGKRCKKCHDENKIKSEDEIRKEVEEGGCQYVGGYIGKGYPFDYICSCGNPSRIRIGDFRKNVRCHRCKGERGKAKKRERKLKELEKYLRNKETNIL